jgi:hypothetical protein
MSIYFIPMIHPTSRSQQASPRTNPPKPVPPPFTFSSPHDTPSGAYYRQTASGFVATSPAGSWLMALVFGGICVAFGYMLFNTLRLNPSLNSFTVVMGIVLSVTLIFFSFFAFGKEGVEIRGEKLYLKKTVFGLGLRQVLNWRKVVRAQVIKRSGSRGLGFLLVSHVTDQVLEFETDTHIKKMGTNLKAEHLYYMRYLIIEAVKASRAKPGSSM